MLIGNKTETRHNRSPFLIMGVAPIFAGSAAHRAALGVRNGAVGGGSRALREAFTRAFAGGQEAGSARARLAEGDPGNGQYLAYVGTYTRSGKSKGIYAYSFVCYYVIFLW